MFYPRSSITASLDGAPRERSSRKVHAFERMSDRLAAPASLISVISQAKPICLDPPEENPSESSNQSDSSVCQQTTLS